MSVFGARTTLKYGTVQSNNKGFSLLEVIVVLLIVSFVSLILMQGLTHYLKVQERIADKLSHSHIKHLQYSWFREVVNGMVAMAEVSERFQGDKKAIAGVSISGLDQRAGVPTRFVIKLEKREGRHYLTYYPEAQLQTPNLLSAYNLKKKSTGWVLLSVAAKDSFSYVDSAGNRHSEWPPKKAKTTGLPDAIVLVREDAKSEQREWWVSIKGDKRVPPKLDDGWAF